MRIANVWGGGKSYVDALRAAAHSTGTGERAATGEIGHPTRGDLFLIGIRVSRIEDQDDAFEPAFDEGDFLFQMLEARRGDFVNSDATIGRGNSPFDHCQRGFERALQRRWERTLFCREQVVRSLLNVLHQRLAMSRLAAKRPEDHHLECTGKKNARAGVGHGPSDKKHRAEQRRFRRKAKKGSARRRALRLILQRLVRSVSYCFSSSMDSYSWRAMPARISAGVLPSLVCW